MSDLLGVDLSIELLDWHDVILLHFLVKSTLGHWLSLVGVGLGVLLQVLDEWQTVVLSHFPEKLTSGQTWICNYAHCEVMSFHEAISLVEASHSRNFSVNFKQFWLNSVSKDNTWVVLVVSDLSGD